MKQVFILSMIAAGMLLFASCGQKEDAVIEVTSITITPSTLTLTVGDQQTLTATVEPENAADKTIAWSSSDPSIAEVGASSGEVTAKAAGTATVTATAANGRTATCEVTVSEVVIEVTSVTVSPNSLDLKTGEKQTLTATVEPQDATDKTVMWSSSNPSIAEVGASSGEVTAKASGTATITATAGGRTATCEVTVWEVVGELVQEGEIPLIAYGGGTSDGRMKSAGIDMCWSWANLANVTEALDEAHRAGIKLLIATDFTNPDTETVVNTLKGHPGLGGYILSDEPPIQGFDKLDALVREIQKFDTEHLCYINLLPNYASPEQLGTSSYLEYLRTYAKLTTGFISFDFYPTNGRNVHANWYVNMRDVRDVANEHDIPFWAYVNSSRGRASDPAFTLGELSLMVYTNLAYGSQAIQYFMFACSSKNSDPYFRAPITDGTRTPTYDLVRKINTDIKRLSHIFSKSKVLGVWHTGSTLPAGTVRLQEENPPEMPPVKSLKTDVGGALVSLIEKDNNRYLVIVNRNYLSPMTLTLTVDRNAVSKVLKDGTLVRTDSETIKMEIEAGDVTIYKWEK